jgi:AhpD family alkylhydroperoxidase
LWRFAAGDAKRVKHWTLHYFSVTNQCNYCIASHSAAARKAGMTDSMFSELMAVVGMANETNRLASGYQVEIDEQFKVR